MKKNNIKKYETPKKLHQLIEDCEEYLINFDSNIKEHSILSFFSSNIFVKQKYLDLLSKSYLDLFSINIFFLVMFLLSQIAQICFSVFEIEKKNKYRKRIIIIEIILLIIIFLSIILLLSKKIQENKIYILIISWILFLFYFVTILVIMYNNNTCGKGIFISKFYSYFISSHILMILMITANMSLHFGHFFIIGFLDIFILIILNITNYKTNFYHYSNSIILTALFIISQSYKFELSIKKVFDFCVEKYYSYLINEETLENGDIGICLTTDDFEILKMNQTLNNNMKEVFSFEKAKNKNFLLYNLIIQKDETIIKGEHRKINLLQAIEETINNYMIRGKQDNLEYFVPLGRFKIKQGTKLFSIKFKRILVKNYEKNQKKIFKNPDFKLSEIFDLNNSSKVNLNISKNNITLNNSDNILTFPNISDNEISKNNIYNYKFIFTLITNNRKLDRMKVEQIYQKLILTKVSNEFNTPVHLIQDLMNKLIKEKEDNEEKTLNESKSPFIGEESKSPKDSQAELMMKNRELFDDNKTIKNLSYRDRRSLTSIKSNSEMFQYNNIETFLFIKYIADTIKLSAMDLTQYIKIHSTSDKTIEELNLEVYTLSEIREYIEGIGNAYLNLMGKSINFITTMDNLLTKRNIEIDKDKLNQILSNLISNSIKNTKNATGIIANISKMKEYDLKYFEYGANKDIFENNNYNIEINATQISNINNIELGLVISIEDSGTGISNTLIKDINSEGVTFYRKDTLETKINNSEEYMISKGLGSGLKICKKLSDEMGIKLKCHVKPNNTGTIFKIYVKTELFYN